MHQHEQVCEAICKAAGFRGCWNADGVTPAFDATQKKAFASSQELLLAVALDVWNGHGGAQLARVVNVLDNGNLTMIGRLLVAIANGGYDGAEVGAWLDAYDRQRRDKGAVKS